MHRNVMTNLTAVTATALLATSAQATTIDIDGRPANSVEASALEWGDNTGLTDNAIGSLSDPIPNVSVNDGVVSLTASTNGQLWSTGYSSGSYDAGEEWNVRQASDTGVVATTATAAFTGGRYIEFTLDSTGFASDVFDWDSVSVSLWRNGAQAPNNFQLAVDADANGWTVSDLVGSAVTQAAGASGTANTVNLTYAGASLPDGVTTGTVRLYYWDSTGTTNAGGNFHLYDLSADYTVVPEPGSLALLALGGLAMLRRRRNG